MISYHNYKEGLYKHFSDWAPYPVHIYGFTYPCSAMALFSQKALAYGEPRIIEALNLISILMSKFVSDFSNTDSPRFWSRWDEQLLLVIDYNRQMSDEEKLLDYYKNFYRKLYDVYTSKITNSSELLCLLISTGEKFLSEGASSTDGLDWRDGREIAYFLYPDADIQRDISVICLTRIREELTSYG